MSHKFLLPALTLGLLVAFSGMSHAKPNYYKSAAKAARYQGAYRFSRNSTLRKALGTMNRKRIVSKYMGKTKAGHAKYKVSTRKFYNGAPATTYVTIQKVKPSVANKGNLFRPFKGKAVYFYQKATK